MSSTGASLKTRPELQENHKRRHCGNWMKLMLCSKISQTSQRQSSDYKLQNTKSSLHDPPPKKTGSIQLFLDPSLSWGANQCCFATWIFSAAIIVETDTQMIKQPRPAAGWWSSSRWRSRVFPSMSTKFDLSSPKSNGRMVYSAKPAANGNLFRKREHKTCLKSTYWQNRNTKCN